MTEARSMTRAAQGGEGARRAAILAEAAAVAAALDRRPLTVAELPGRRGCPLRQAYRTLWALVAAGWPV